MHFDVGEAVVDVGLDLVGKFGQENRGPRGQRQTEPVRIRGREGGGESTRGPCRAWRLAALDSSDARRPRPSLLRPSRVSLSRASAAPSGERLDSTRDTRSVSPAGWNAFPLPWAQFAAPEAGGLSGSEGGGKNRPVDTRQTQELCL